MDKILKPPIRNFSLHNILKCQERFKISNGVKILIISVITLGLGLFAVPSAKATEVGELIIEWSINGSDWQPLSGRIFDEANFLPGDGVVRLIRATNNTAGTLKIGTKAVGYSTCSGICFADKLKLKITESSNTLYENSLTNFFGQEEVALSDVAPGGAAIYNFTITFLPDSNNDYQNTNVSFNLIVGALGTESISGEIMPGGGGSGGGFFIPGLQIFNEAASGIGGGQATITWQTNKDASSRVIYSSQFQPHTLQLGNPPNYGYANSTGEDSTPAISHQMVITGLDSGTTYYFRCVSHGSFAVSVEHSFTTPGTKKTVAGEEAFVYEGTGLGPAGEGEAIPEELTEGSVKGETTGETAVGQEESGMGLEKLLAAIGSFFGSGNLCWLLLLLIIILIVLFLLSVAGKKQEKKKQWILPLIILILIILYSFLSCANYLWLVIIISLSAILFLILRKRLTKPVPTEQP